MAQEALFLAQKVAPRTQLTPVRTRHGDQGTPFAYGYGNARVGKSEHWQPDVQAGLFEVQTQFGGKTDHVGTCPPPRATGFVARHNPPLPDLARGHPTPKPLRPVKQV